MTSQAPPVEIATAPRIHRRAFTLIELVVVIGLIGVMMGMVFLKLDTLVPRERLKAASREIASRLDQAFNQAVVSGHDVRFEYDLDNAAYRFLYPFEFEEDGVTIKGEGETEIIEWTALPDGVRFEDVTLGDGDAFTSGVVFVTFHPSGVATPHAVHLVSPEYDRHATILVSALFGSVSVASGYQQPQLQDDGLFD